ncbi:MAG: AsmA family protein, partial [Janthinobacterium lividum]
MTRRRVVLALAAMAVLLMAGAATAAALLFDGEALKLRAIEAVRRATGRELTIAGPVRLGWSLTPTVTAEGVSLANPPGMSRPAMATLDRLDAQIALWPLLRRRMEVRGLTLIGPDVLLERDAAGQPNWVFTRPTAPLPETAPAVPGAPAARLQLSVNGMEVRDGRLGWLSGVRRDTLTIPALQARTETPGTVRLAGTAALDGVPLDVQGTTGTLAAADGAWPLDLTLSGGGAKLHAAGALGAAVALTADVPDLAALSQIAGRPLPPLRDIRASAQLGPAGLSALAMQAAGGFGPVRLSRLTLSAPALDQPLSLAADGTAGGTPVTMTATAGSLAALLRPGPVPVTAQAQMAGATITADGTADARAGTAEMQVSARVPNLQALGTLAGARLPGWHGVSLDGRVSTTAP